MDPSTRPATAAGREIEWQLDAVDLRPVERWLRSQAGEGEPGVRVGAPATKDLADVYADTADWRLHGAGWTLRVRRTADGFEATMKSMAPIRDDRRDRREVTETAPSEDPRALGKAPGEVGAQLRALVGSRPLAPLFEVRTRRTVFPLELGGRPAGEVALDDTSFPIPGEDRPARIQRVEVEVDAEAVAEVEPFVVAMRTTCALQPAARSKFEAGLVANGLAVPGPVDLGPTEVDATLTIGQVAFAVMRKHFSAFLAREPGTRLGEDPEELHDMRVATRRLRAAIATFADVLPVRAVALRNELRWVAGALGAVRDLDVQLEQVRTWQAEMPEEDGRALEPVLRLLEGRRHRARADLLRQLDSRRFDRLVASFGAMLRRGPLRTRTASREPILAAGPPLIQRRYRRVRRAGNGIGPESPPAEFHKLRIRAKRLRYVVEFLSPVYPDPAAAFVKRMVRLQDLLGLHQDAQVAMGHLRELTATHGPELSPFALFLLGRVAERYSNQAEALRRRFPKVYGKVSSAAWKDLRRAMTKSAGTVPKRTAARPRPQEGPSKPAAAAAGAAERGPALTVVGS